jgi:predicted nucleic acid-binding protein
VSWLVDTNILIRLAEDDDPRHLECSSAVEALAADSETMNVCAQVIAEFWCAATRPKDVNGLGFGFDEAIEETRDLRGTFPCLAEPSDIADHWQRVVIQNRVMGKQCHDARIVALMLAHGVTHILTLNPSDFARYAGITALTPQDVLDNHAG